MHNPWRNPVLFRSAIVARRFAVSVGLAITFAGGVIAADAPSATTIGEIAQIWRENARQVRTIYAELYMQEVVPRGTAMPPDNAKPDEAFPNEDTTLELDCTLRLDAERWRHDRNGPQWYQPAASFVRDENFDEFFGAAPGRPAHA